MAKKGIMIDGIIINTTNESRVTTIQEVSGVASSGVKRTELNPSHFQIRSSDNQVSIKQGSVSEKLLSDDVSEKANRWNVVEDELFPEDSYYKMRDEFDLDMTNRKITEVSDLDFKVDPDGQNHLYKQGRMFYDKNTGRMTYYNDKSDVKIEVGSEFLIRVINNTGSTILNGTPVYLSSVSNGIIEISKANCIEYEKSRLVGIATMDIPNGSEGEVTKFGKIGSVDTSSFFAGDVLYLGTTDGTITNIKPTGEAYITTLGICQKSHSSEGTIMVDITTNHLSAEVNNTNGFASSFQGSGLTISVVNRIFLLRTSGYFSFYQNGIKYRKYASDVVAIPDVEGLHAIYYDLGVLSVMTNPSKDQIADLILNKVLVSYVYWDATSSSPVHIADERHSISMSPCTHLNLHMTRGCQLLSGLGLGDFDVDGNGSLDSQWKFSVSEGIIIDEDISIDIGGFSAATDINVLYLEGNELLRRSTANRIITDSGTGLPCYNRKNPSTNNWELISASSGDYLLYHIFATNSYRDNEKVLTVVGQSVYSKLSDAKEAAAGEVANVLQLIPIEEKIPIGTIILYTKSNYSNSKKAVIVSTPDGKPYIDWRKTEIIQGINPSSHDDLTEVYNVGSGVSKGHISDQAETIYGVKTFADGIVTPSDLIMESFNSGTTTIDTTLSSIGDGIIYQVKAKNTVGDIKVGELYIAYSAVNGVSILSNLTGFGDLTFDVVGGTSSVSLTATTTTNNWTLLYTKKIL